MPKHVVVGAGPVGSAIIEHLLQRGEEVVVVTRSGTAVGSAQTATADAADADRLAALCDGATAVYNCVNPPYHRWREVWPAVSASLIGAAERSGAVLATTGNLYPYGPVKGPMSEGLPDAGTGIKAQVRARMSREAFAAHEAGRIRTVEVRGSDYLGGNSYLEAAVTPALRKGRTAWVPADLDAPHTFTNVHDVARTLVAAVDDPSSWGRTWHVPSADPVTMRDIAGIAARELGVRAKVRSLPYAAVWAAGAVNPFIKELRETQYQFRAPYVLDSSAAQEHFDIVPTPLEESVRLDLAHSAQSE